MSFDASLRTLVGPLTAPHHAHAAALLSRCRGRPDLDALVDDGGWLGPEEGGKRLKLVRHASGTYLVVEYEDGWSTRVSQAGFA